MMADLPDLQFSQPITNEDGTPSPYFLRYLLDRKGFLTDQEAALVLKADQTTQIIAGTGLTGGGDLSADRTLTADEQAILDEITTTRGSILYRGASGWAGLAPGTNGHFLKSNGAGADPAYAAASGGGGGWTPTEPEAADFPTAVKHASIGAATLIDHPYSPGVKITFPRNTTSGSWRQSYLYQAAPSGTTWRAEARLNLVQRSNNNYFFDGIGVGYSGDDNKNIAIQTVFNTASDIRVGNVATFPGLASNNDGSATGDEDLSLYGQTYSGPVWYALERDGDDIDGYFSFDGYVWVHRFTIDATTFLGGAPDRIGFAHMSLASDSGDNFVYCDHWYTTTDLSEAVGLNRT